MVKFCQDPFENVEIYDNGNVFFCCAHFHNYIPIGNIYLNSYDEIWNSERAQKVRQSILKSDFSYCSDMCFKKTQESLIKEDYNIIMKRGPHNVAISSDNTCNVRCVFCRDKNINNNIFDDKHNNIINKLLPFFQDAKKVRIGCTGEPFASQKEKELIKEIIKINSDIKFEIYTNGILGDLKKLKEYNIYNNIYDLKVSIHAATEETYKKVVRGGSWNKLLKNLDLYSEMHNNLLIKDFYFVFTVFSYNYHEIPQFLEFAKKYNAHVYFWGFRKNDTVELGKNYDQYAVFETQHPEHTKLAEILKSINWENENATLFPELKSLIE